MTKGRHAGDAIGRVAVSFLAGIVIGNLLWVPYSGALAIGLALGGLVLTFPLAFAAAVVAVIADQAIKKRPILWCVAAVVAVTSIYALFDPPLDQNGIGRVALALTCCTVSAIVFFVLTRTAKSKK